MTEHRKVGRHIAIDRPASFRIESEDNMNTQQITGTGRADLIARVDELTKRNKELEQQRDQAWSEAKAANANLTSTQARCTELMNLNRLSDMFDKTPSTVASLIDLAWAIETARAKHPEGSDLTSLVAEVGEVARAMYVETPERVRDELLDVAVVAMRLRYGEVKKSQVGFEVK